MGDITMSIRDTRRIAILDTLKHKSIKQRKAAALMGVSIRQVRRLLTRYTRDGAKGIIHQLRGLPGNHQADATTLDQALETIRTKYPDFSVTLAHEKLVQSHSFPYSHETLRLAMIKAGIWQVKRPPKAVIHQIRERRSQEGELVQIDGSPYDWFEGRCEYCSLLVFIDDATGKLGYLQFVPHETTNGYLAGMKYYIEQYGKPKSLYSDRHGIFRINQRRQGSASVNDELGITQFGRAMQELSIELIFANSPQAKGRVERVNQTLQDRLTKELRLLGITTMEEANHYLPTFMAGFNQQFGVLPASPENAHTPLAGQEKLEEILVQKHPRVISTSLTLSYENKLYQIASTKVTNGYSLRHKQIEVWEDTQGSITIHSQDKILPYTVASTHYTGHIVDSKRLNEMVDELKPKLPRKYAAPAPNHPWRSFTLGRYQSLLATT